MKNKKVYMAFKQSNYFIKVVKVYSWLRSKDRKFSEKRLKRTKRNIEMFLFYVGKSKSLKEIARENDLTVGHVRATINLMTSIYIQNRYECDLCEAYNPQKEKERQEFHKAHWYLNKLYNRYIERKNNV